MAAVVGEACEAWGCRTNDSNDSFLSSDCQFVSLGIHSDATSHQKAKAYRVHTQLRLVSEVLAHKHHVLVRSICLRHLRLPRLQASSSFSRLQAPLLSLI